MVPFDSRRDGALVQGTIRLGSMFRGRPPSQRPRLIRSSRCCGGQPSPVCGLRDEGRLRIRQTEGERVACLDEARSVSGRSAYATFRLDPLLALLRRDRLRLYVACQTKLTRRSGKLMVSKKWLARRSSPEGQASRWQAKSGGGGSRTRVREYVTAGLYMRVLFC